MMSAAKSETQKTAEDDAFETLNGIPLNEESARQFRKRMFQTKDGTEFTVSVRREATERLSQELFGNTAGFNTLTVTLKTPCTHLLPWYDGTQQVTHVNAYGIVLSVDTVDSDEKGFYGYHNYLIPWSDIARVYQYIET